MSESILNQFRLDGRTALVVGGNRGLGFEMAKALAEAGASIFIAARDEARNADAQSRIAKLFGRPSASRRCDITEPNDVAATIAAAVEKFGTIDILINSAGINIRGPIDGVSPEDFEKVQRVNVTGTWLMCREVMPLMKRQRYGRIINVGSMLSVVGMADRTPYAA
ncbi:MAG TPA: SDR family NAD(P)-dependent oxidoreductase, partial [Lacipirellulaceae bacterium]|nr:SDR family NAD(P)-dependent oxidoreductase [Lacipirellulaceae bacterium]